MSKDKDLHERIKRVKEKGKNNAEYHFPDSMESQSAKEKFNEQDTSIEQSENKTLPNLEKKQPNKKIKRNKKILGFGTFAIAIGIIAFIFPDIPTVDTSEGAQNALANKMSTTVSAGAILMEDDDDIGAKDHTITHDSQADETKIWVWDYAAEDGDYVQVLVNGKPISDSFMIRHKPREFKVPTVGKVQIKGVRDGGGGITYAVRYDVNSTSYFNTAPQDGFNTYELVRE